MDHQRHLLFSTKTKRNTVDCMEEGFILQIAHLMQANTVAIMRYISILKSFNSGDKEYHKGTVTRVCSNDY